MGYLTTSDKARGTRRLPSTPYTERKRSRKMEKYTFRNRPMGSPGVFNKYLCLLIYRNNPPTVDRSSQHFVWYTQNIRPLWHKELCVFNQHKRGINNSYNIYAWDDYRIYRQMIIILWFRTRVTKNWTTNLRCYMRARKRMPNSTQLKM